MSFYEPNLVTSLCAFLYLIRVVRDSHIRAVYLIRSPGEVIPYYYKCSIFPVPS